MMVDIMMAITPAGNSTTEGYTSTLLIPEKTVWLPYVGLVMMVLVWLGYDFYRFHGKNKQKYVRIEEHMTILRAVPSRQRITMISGIGLRFRRGRPILGDVWNTSPSSSDMSSYCGTARRNALVSFSREVTPSDDDEEYSETDLFAGSKTGSHADLVGNEVLNTPYRGWQIGGEYLTDSIEKLNSPKFSLKEEDRNLLNIEEPLMSEDEDHIQVSSVPRAAAAPKGVGASITTTSISDKHHPTSSTSGGAGGGVDDGGGGGIPQRLFRDVATQTELCEFRISVSSHPDDVTFNPNRPFYFPGQSPNSISSRMNKSAEMLDPLSPLFLNGGFPGTSGPPRRDSFISRHSSASRSLDIPANSPTTKFSSGRTDKRHPPPLRLDLPYSPTTEIVATKHGFAVEGLEVPHFPGSGGRSLTPDGNEHFKQSSSHKGHSIIKPLNPSPAVVARVSSSRPLSPRYPTSNPHTSSQRSQRHRYKRQNSMGVNSPENISSKPSSPSKRTTQSLPATPHHKTPASSYPRMGRDDDESGEAMSLKTLKDSTSYDPPNSDPIPSHMYHEDEEGFFSSVTSSQVRRMHNRDADDSSNKGILFFSRLAGAGRSHDDVMGGGRHMYGSYKSGGFES